MKRVLLIDDHEIVRDGVKRLFTTDTALFGEASTPREALQLAVGEHWDLAILDLSLGDRSGLQLLRELKQALPALPVLVLTMHAERHYARRAFKAGAAGYVTKDSPRAEISRAIQQVISGKKYISPKLTELVLADFERGSDQPLHETLSNRELEVLRLLAQGKTVTDIARLLSLSDKTISTHRAHILEKMRMKTTAELIHYAVRNQLVT